jgi:hypothetical protein
MALDRLLAEGTGAELVATHVYERATPHASYAGWGSFMWARSDALTPRPRPGPG